jgi:hypothetical protein
MRQWTKPSEYTRGDRSPLERDAAAHEIKAQRWLTVNPKRSKAHSLAAEKLREAMATGRKVHVDLQRRWDDAIAAWCSIGGDSSNRGNPTPRKQKP